jgi:tetratricopeptide (TPR) repeat protein
MHILKNRVIISLILIVLATYFWEFWVKPVTGPIYTEAVREYKSQHYARSLQLLRQAHRVDPNDTAILALMGWNYLKMGDPKAAEEPYFRRAHDLSPHVVDIALGYAYTEIELGKYEQARQLLDQLRQAGVDTADMHVAEGTYYRQQGRYRDAAREFKAALQREEKNVVAIKNLQELLNTADVRDVTIELPPYKPPQALTYPARVQGDYFSWKTGNQWQPAYLVGVDLTPALPGSFPAEAVTDTDVYLDWLTRISDLGANTIRVYTLLPPAFYRALRQLNGAPGRKPLWLLQGVSFTDPPHSDMFEGEYLQSCQKDLRDAIDVIHGRGSVAAGSGQPGGVYTEDVSQWVAGLLIGQAWLPHVVTANNQLHPDLKTFQGTYVEVPAGSATEIFLAQMINYTAQYEEEKYNWQHPVAFINWPTLDPIRHPTESTLPEEISIRRAMGEHVKLPAGPYDDDDAVSVDPTHLKARPGFVAGYFAAYSVLPYYPDFLNQDPGYLAVRDAEGSNPFLGYLRDLKSRHRGLPLLIADYGIPTSLGVGHFSAGGFDEGGKTEMQQGQLLARLTRSVRTAGAAGGTIQEWLDQWHRLSWVQRDFETPPDRRLLWDNLMNPAEHFGLMAADPGRRKVHLLAGDPAEWGNTPPFYAEFSPSQVQAVGDRFDPARDLKALYADADEGFLYLRLVVGKLDNDGDGRPDWKEVNYLIGVGTAPELAGLTSLPYIARLPFPMGMTYAIQLAGPESGQILIASSYNPFHILPVEGIPSQSSLLPKLGWKPSLSESGSFEPQIGEPNRRRFARDGQYFPPQRYDRGALHYGTLDHQDADYNSLAEWHANVRTSTIDLRIPWNLLNVTDPSSLKIFAGTQEDGTVLTADTPGFVLAAFSYRPPAQSGRGRSIMAQNSPVVDALPGMTGPRRMDSSALKEFRWAGWDAPHYDLRPKDSIAILRKAFQSLPTAPPARPVASKTPVNLGDMKKRQASRSGGVSRSGR